ncbi:MAG: SUMF1/EgtB/PvdO family nonheme iron enzyme [Caldilineaceae bacterium]
MIVAALVLLLALDTTGLPHCVPGHAGGNRGNQGHTGDGATQVYVPAGPFIMGSRSGRPNAQPDEIPQRTVTVSSFWIDQTEVTNARHQARRRRRVRVSS